MERFALGVNPKTQGRTEYSGQRHTPDVVTRSDPVFDAALSGRSSVCFTALTSPGVVLIF